MVTVRKSARRCRRLARRASYRYQLADLAQQPGARSLACRAFCKVALNAWTFSSLNSWSMCFTSSMA